jgi:hypothetical protein
LPEIIVNDADWFFWAIENQVLNGRLADEAEELMQRATAIKIRRPDRGRWCTEYQFEKNGRFHGFEIVDVDFSFSSRSLHVRRSPYLDLSCLRRGRCYDKLGCRNLLRDFRRHFFGGDTYLTRRRIEKFFSCRKNFIARIEA